MGVLDEIEEEIADLQPDDPDDVPDRDGVYDPVDDLDDREPVTVGWPEVDPIKRDLSPEEWGMRGEGPPDMWRAFAGQLNDGRLGAQPAEITLDEPEWGEASLPEVRSDQKERGKTIYVRAGVSPATLFRCQGQIGHNVYGRSEPREFANTLQPKVEDYRDRFEDGDRPGRGHIYLDTDGKLAGPQEGRHRAAAAHLAGVDWYPVVIIRRTEGTFTRWKDRGTGRYRKDYSGQT